MVGLLRREGLRDLLPWITALVVLMGALREMAVMAAGSKLTATITQKDEVMRTIGEKNMGIPIRKKVNGTGMSATGGSGLLLRLLLDACGESGGNHQCEEWQVGMEPRIVEYKKCCRRS